MSDTKKRYAVIGAGPMGLMAAYELLKKGHAVDIYERDDRIGGMSATFDFDGMRIERYYHFVCGPDQPFFDCLEEFGVADKLRWTNTKMGFYYEGKLYKWGDPISLLKFPKLGLISKLRYGVHALFATRIKDYRPYDKLYAKDWLMKWIGNKVYKVIMEPLFKYKFYEYQNDLSASWIGTRIRRIGLSRKSLFQEQLGYLEGGSETLLKEMEKRILEMGGQIHLESDVKQVVVKGNQVTGVKVGRKTHAADGVVSTVPLPYVSKLVPDLPEPTRTMIDDIVNVGVACVVFKLKKPISENFWMNVNDSRMEIPGVIEYSNLNPTDNKIVYVPYYMPSTHEKYKWKDQQFIEEVTSYLKMINSDFNDDWVLATHVARYGFSQTVCTPHFYDKLPPMKSTVDGLYMADTAYCYPEDRSICESVKVAKEMVALVD